MAKEFSKAFYQSKEWKRCRDAYKASVNFLCERCKAKGKVTTGDIVHHKILLTPNNINNPVVTLNHEELELLCIDCHNKEHIANDALDEGLKFDSGGQIVTAPLSKISE